MQEIVSLSSLDTKQPRRSARRLGAFEKSVIVKWCRRRRRRRRHPPQPTPPPVLFVTYLIALSALNKIVASSPQTAVSQPGEHLNPFEDSPTSNPAEYSHTIFSLGDGGDVEPTQDNELGRTLSTLPLGAATSISETPLTRQTESSRREEQPPAAGNSKSDQRHHLHVIDFGDHAEPSELATLLTGGGGGGGGSSGNQTVGAPAQTENNLLKSNADSNRTTKAPIAEPAHFLVQANNQTNQQVGAGRPQNLQSSGTVESAHSDAVGVGQQNSSSSGNGQWSRTKIGRKRKKKKRRKFSSEQQAFQQQNATAAETVGANSTLPAHQMITYVSRSQQLPAHHFERLLNPSQPLAKFLQPSAFKLALNSPLVYRKLQLDERQQPPPLEFTGRYHMRNTNSAGQVVAISPPLEGAQSSRGPFELEQLQATASTRQNKKVQHSMFSQHERAQEQSPPAAGQLLQTHESSKLELVNEELATPTAGQSPAISDHLNDQEEQEDQEDGGIMNEPSSPSLDYETDEAGGELFSSSVHHHGNVPTTHPAGGVSSKRQVSEARPTSGARPADVETGSGNKTTPEASSADEDAEDGRGRQVAAQSKNAHAVHAAQQRLPGLKIANNELLVGPFKSEAEAPATITLAGVVYQKSGSSSALLRASSMTSGDKQVAANDKNNNNNNLDLSLSLVPAGQLSSERAGASVAAAQSSSTPTAIAFTTTNNWPQSTLLHNNINSTPAMSASGSVYLGTIGQSPSPPGSLVPTLAGQTSGGDQSAGEQMSLSSSSAKPTTSKSSLASQLMGAPDELVIATGTSAASLLRGLNQPDGANQLGYASVSSAQQVPASAQLYRQRLPNGSIIWTLNKPVHSSGAGGGGRSSLNGLMQSDSSPSLTSGPGSGGSPFEVGVASSEPSESKHQHHQHNKGGPIVIVQKDVKPVKYHLLRAYLKLRRLLRPYEATYVFPGDHAQAASTSTAAVLSSGGGVVGGNAFLRRRQPGSLSTQLQVSRRARRWPRRFLGGGSLDGQASGRLEK